MHLEYSTGRGLFLFYRDKTSASALIQDAMYANDMALVAEARSEMQHMVKVLDKACEQWGMCISMEKTKILTVGEEQETEHPSIILQHQAVEEFESFPYLSSEISQSTVVEKEV